MGDGVQSGVKQTLKYQALNFTSIYAPNEMFCGAVPFQCSLRKVLVVKALQMTVGDNFCNLSQCFHRNS